VPNAEVRILDAGHFALDEQPDAIAGLIRDFRQRPATEKGSSAWPH
jgi:pimeloyl-ACP methyl ester carboxylesterase